LPSSTGFGKGLSLKRFLLKLKRFHLSFYRSKLAASEFS